MGDVPVEDVIEIQQLLARYAVGMTKDDVEAVMEVFTADGTYSAFGDTYPLADFPALVAAAPKGLFLVGPPALDLEGDVGTGEQPLCFVDQTNHDMRIGYYTDTYRRTRAGLAAAHPVDDLPAQERGPRRRPSPRPDPAHPDGGLMELEEFRASLDVWLDRHDDDLRRRFGAAADAGRPDGPTGRSQTAHLRGRLDALGLAVPRRRTRAGPRCSRAYLGEALTSRDLVEPGIYSMTEVLAPTMIDYAAPELAAAMVPRLLSGAETWCQGFSEPGTGSNLAALACRAIRSGDAWRVTGQKVWTSLAQYAQRCVLLTRTGPPESAHRGITALFVDMDTPGHRGSTHRDHARVTGVLRGLLRRRGRPGRTHPR